jgi:hypothetical protein
MKNKMSDHIEEYFAKIEGTKEAFHSRELFKAEEDSIDLKTDLNNEEISLINTLFYNDSLLKEKGLKPVFSKFIYKYMRLKVSKDRLSRSEFVNINKTNTNEDVLGVASNLKNLTDTRK